MNFNEVVYLYTWKKQQTYFFFKEFEIEPISKIQTLKRLYIKRAQNLYISYIYNTFIDINNQWRMIGIFIYKFYSYYIHIYIYYKLFKIYYTILYLGSTPLFSICSWESLFHLLAYLSSCLSSVLQGECCGLFSIKVRVYRREVFQMF